MLHGINVFRVVNPNNNSRSIYINDQFIGVNSDGGDNLLTLGVINNNEGYIDFRGNGYTEVRASGIKTPVLTQTSLEKYKKNFEKLDNETALNIILNTDIYEYNLKSENDDTKKHLGFVIGDKYNYSKAITSTENDGVDNYSMTSASYGAIQRLYSIIQDLQKEIKELKGEQ